MSCEVMGDLKPSISKKRVPKVTNNLSTSLNDENERPTNLIAYSNASAGDYNSNNNGFFNEDDELKYGAKHVIKIFIPVSICMLIVVITILSLPYYQSTRQYMVYTPFTDQKVDTGTRIWQSFANALILITVIAIMSVLLIVLYKKRFYKVINVWLLISTLTLLFLITTAHVFEVFKVLNVPVDTLTITLFIWNFGLIGMITIHWKGPMIVQQSYLLFISSLMALSFIKFIPEWTIWTVLFAVSIWDLIAVLCPKGPLRILVETAQERNEPLFPSLIYSSGMAYVIDQASSSDTETTVRDENQLINFKNDQDEQNNTQQQQNNAQQIPNQDIQQRLLINSQNNIQLTQNSSYISNAGDSSSTPIVNNSSNNLDDQGVKLGLGDFVFYSILVGKVSTYGDWNTTIACFVAILIGLCLTLFLLAIIKTALPALPISITFGLIFYFSTSFVVQPFMSELAVNQIFI